MTSELREKIENLRETALSYHSQGDVATALALLEHVVQSELATPVDWIRYCSMMAEGGDPTAGLSLMRTIAREYPDDALVQINCAIFHFNYSDYETTAKYLINAIQKNMIDKSQMPDKLAALVMCLIYGPFGDPTFLSNTIQFWHKSYIERTTPNNLTKKKYLNEKLRIGYVNNYFDKFVYHTTSLSLIAEHNSEDFDIYCYNLSIFHPPHIRDLRHGIQLKTLGHLSDDEIIQEIVNDDIDILIDMNGFDCNNRWNVYLSHPAPILASWYNVFSPMGGNMFDYIIMDEVLCPPELHKHFKEDVALLPCWMTMDPPIGAPDVAPTPALSSPWITFGCFNRALKINDRTLLLWKRILNAVPNSRLYLRNSSYSNTHARDRVEDLIAEIGIDPQRVTIEGWSERDDFLTAYNEVDILLDPFPFNGGITSLEAMWQGVPMIALNGSSWGAKLGAMILAGANCKEWLAHSEHEYVAIAVKLASDLPELNRIRQCLRERLKASPIMDGAQGARAMEALFRVMAQRYRAANPE